MLFTAPGIVWGILVLLGAAIIGYTCRRVLKIEAQGKKVEVPLMAPHLIVMIFEAASMLLWMITMSILAGWIAVLVAAVHCFVCWKQAWRVDEFDPNKVAK